MSLRPASSCVDVSFSTNHCPGPCFCCALPCNCLSASKRNNPFRGCCSFYERCLRTGLQRAGYNLWGLCVKPLPGQVKTGHSKPRKEYASCCSSGLEMSRQAVLQLFPIHRSPSFVRIVQKQGSQTLRKQTSTAGTEIC